MYHHNIPLAQFITNLRMGSELTQDAVATQLGVSRQTYAHIEDGKRELTISEATTLAQFFGMSLEALLACRLPQTPTIVIQEKKTKKKQEDTNIRINVPQERVEMFKEVLLYILNRVGARPNIGETAIYKLLYFIDFDYYEKYEQQLIGATYIKNYHGPTPVMFKKIVDDMIADGDLEQVKSTYFDYPQKKYLPHRAPRLEMLTARDIKHIDETIDRLAHKNASELSEYSHNDIPWKSHEMGEEIEYESVFYRDDAYSVKTYADEL